MSAEIPAAGRPIEEGPADQNKDGDLDHGVAEPYLSRWEREQKANDVLQHRFFELLFDGAAQSELRIMIWGKSHGTTCLCDRVSEAVSFATGWGSDQDIYVGAGLYRPDSILAKGISECVNAITSLRLDVDVHDRSVHPRTNLPMTFDEGNEFLGTLPLRPSMVINSGHVRIDR